MNSLCPASSHYGILRIPTASPGYAIVQFQQCMTSQSGADLCPIILTYHSISSGPLPLSVTPRLFSEQIEWLKDNAEVVPLSVLVDALASGKSPAPRTIAITFDDGYADFYHSAAPVLCRAGFPSTVFLPTAFCGRTSTWVGLSNDMHHQPILNWQQIRELAEHGVTFGSHTVTHAELPRLSPAAIEHEINASNADIEAHVGVPVRFFCYPYGRYNAVVRDVVSRHYCAACSTILSPVSRGTDLFTLPRLDAFYLRNKAVFRGLFTYHMHAYFFMRRLVRALREGTGYQTAIWNL